MQEYNYNTNRSCCKGFSVMSVRVYFITRYCTLILISYLASFTIELHAQAARDFMFMDITTVDPLEANPTPSKAQAARDFMFMEITTVDPLEANPMPSKTSLCGSPPRLDYAQPKDEFLQQTSFLKASKVEYNCRPGFARSYGTKPYVICLDDATWSPVHKFCERRSCGFPGEIENGEMTAESFTFGSRVTYTCNNGYKMTSRKNYRECLADGSWSNTIPLCEVQVCPSPQSIINGKFYPIKDEYVYLDSVTYSCNRNLALIGEKSISCKEDGQWSAKPPNCKDIRCMYPVVPNAARILGTGGPYYLNSVIGFQCYAGYVINGSTHITCNENSIWEPEPPKCLGLCWNSPLLSYAELEKSTMKTSFVEGTTLKLKCRAGYEPVSGAKDTITCKGKVWEMPVPFCTPISCGNPGLINNGNIKGETFFFGSIVTYVCSSGYKIKDGKTRKCQANGTWSLPIPECEVQTCHIPNITIGLEYSPVKLQYQHGENVTYTCAEGYHLIGQPTSTCNHEGTWSLAEPFCRKMCHAPPELEFAYPRINQRSDTIFLQWEKVFYDCRYGYILNTRFENSLTCLGQFKWSEPENFCTRIFCGPPKNVTHAEFKAKDFFVDSEAFYECNKGYQMVTKYNSIKCLINGQWSTPVPRCKVQTCPPPEALKDGSYSNKKDKYNYMESVTYICKNLTVVGEASVSCTAEGNWTSGAPECKAVCTSPPVLGFGKLVEEYSKQLYFDIDTTIKYDCQPGFVAVENKKPTVTCLSNNKWSKPEVFCKRLSCGNPGNIDHAEMEAKDFLFGSQVIYTCKSGYNMISRKNYRECQANGSWSVDLPVCKESICDKIWQLQEEARMCTSTPDDWIKYLQVHYLFLQIQSLKLDIEIKKKQLG